MKLAAITLLIIVAYTSVKANQSSQDFIIGQHIGLNLDANIDLITSNINDTVLNPMSLISYLRQIPSSKEEVRQAGLQGFYQFFLNFSKATSKLGKKDENFANMINYTLSTFADYQDFENRADELKHRSGYDVYYYIGEASILLNSNQSQNAGKDIGQSIDRLRNMPSSRQRRRSHCVRQRPLKV
eukprot:TRINITY_DN12160_c0_g1_i1.p1 TRINITY_DN12160_c0_g1~~TRINITY_DN12160_c0_g1_i1.p1  ORF type:complete len:185 (-),score=14.72 TRINITY_DN12160_c0_g1_i1:116-670(-)